MCKFDLSKPYCFYFNEIAKIPHGSFDEEKIADYVYNFGLENGLETIRDEYNNIIIYKEASKGYEDSAPLLLQAHLDMVCEKNGDSDHDFKKDPLDLYVEDGFLKARGTTLGADDGAGVAYILSILADDKLSHPKLECVFTVQEEVGLCGALNLNTSLIKSRRMISLDGNGEVTTAITSAGGCVVTQSLDLKYIPNDKPCYKLFITGLSGGHSGNDIHLEKGNANKLAFRILEELGGDINLISVHGGLKDNAIPRECEIEFSSLLPFETIDKAVEQSVIDIGKELEFSDNQFECSIYQIDKVDKVIDSALSKQIIDYVFLLPNGHKHRSMAIEGLTTSSLNLGIINTVDNKIIMESSLRSNLDCNLDHMIDEIRVLARMFNISIDVSARYPGWKYKANSDMRDKLNKIIMEEYDKPLVVIAKHSGLECGVFASIDDDMDVITYGPIMEGIHTPNERLGLESFDRAYKVLTKLIAECK